MKKTVRISVEFPKEHYPFLKMLCAQNGKSLKDFASQLLLLQLEEYEDHLLAKKADARLKEMNEDDLIDFDEAITLAGWSNDNEIQNIGLE